MCVCVCRGKHTEASSHKNTVADLHQQIFRQICRQAEKLHRQAGRQVGRSAGRHAGRSTSAEWFRLGRVPFKSSQLIPF